MGGSGSDMRPPDTSDPDRAINDARAEYRIVLPRFVTITLVATILYVARDVFLPLAIATLITFALSPIAKWLRRLGMSRLWSVLSVVSITFVAVALFFLVVVHEAGQLSRSLPTFQANILTKIDTVAQASSGDGLLSRISEAATRINERLREAFGSAPDTGATEAAQQGTPAGPKGGGSAAAGSAAAGSGSAAQDRAADKPMTVEVVDRRAPLQILSELVLPIVAPIAAIGLVVVVVIFMLLEREDLRDRFIRLVGTTDIHRATQLLEDAGARLSNYLSMLVLVNALYALPILVGMWLLGVPNAPLIGILTFVFRFIPYIGSVLAAAVAISLAFASTPGWAVVLWALALFALVEFVTSNVIEPWLYGSRTGLSSLAIIIAAIFWTFLWGPLGLVLATPLTVCLVVLGRHVPQFEIFDILFGDEPVLAPPARLYQRLLAGDETEITLRAEEALDEEYLVDYYREVGIPALQFAQADLGRGFLTEPQRQRIAKTGQALIGNLDPVAEEERAALGSAEEPPGAGAGSNIVCVGGRTLFDDLSAAMLAQSMRADGADAAAFSRTALAPQRIGEIFGRDAECVILSFLDLAPSRTSLMHVRRLKRARPALRAGVVIWGAIPPTGNGTGETADATQAKLDEALDLGADFAVTGMDAALAAAYAKEPPRPLPGTRRPRPARRATKAAKTSPGEPAVADI